MPPGPLPDPGSEMGGIGSGFLTDMEAPLLVFEKPLGRLPFPDVIVGGTRVLTLSGRAKKVFETIDGKAFEFCRAVARLHDGSSGPDYWLADVTRFLDAVDESQSVGMRIEEKIIPYNGRTMRRVHLGFGGEDTVFKSSVVDEHHIFRLTYSSGIFLDADAAEAVRRAKLRGVTTWPSGVTNG